MSVQCQTSEVEPLSNESLPTLDSITNPADQRLNCSIDVDELSQTLKSTPIFENKSDKGKTLDLTKIYSYFTGSFISFTGSLSYFTGTGLISRELEFFPFFPSHVSFCFPRDSFCFSRDNFCISREGFVFHGKVLYFTGTFR